MKTVFRFRHLAQCLSISIPTYKEQTVSTVLLLISVRHLSMTWGPERVRIRSVLLFFFGLPRQEAGSALGRQRRIPQPSSDRRRQRACGAWHRNAARDIDVRRSGLRRLGERGRDARRRRGPAGAGGEGRLIIVRPEPVEGRAWGATACSPCFDRLGTNGERETCCPSRALPSSASA